MDVNASAKLRQGVQGEGVAHPESQLHRALLENQTVQCMEEASMPRPE